MTGGRVKVVDPFSTRLDHPTLEDGLPVDGSVVNLPMVIGFVPEVGQGSPYKSPFHGL